MNIVTKDYFYRKVKDTEFKSFYFPDNICFNKDRVVFFDYYLEIPGKGFFIAFPVLKRIIIPSSYLGTLGVDDIMASSEVDLSDWVLEKLSDTPDKRYILNQYKKHSSYYKPRTLFKLGDPGSYLLKNTRTGEKMDFSLIVTTDGYSSDRYLCFPEKTEELLRMKEINRKENFIIYITNEKTDSEADQGSDIKG